MSLMLALLLAQVGPSVSPGAGGALPQAPLEIPRKAKPGEPAPTSAAPSRLNQCLAMVRTAPLDALEEADAWLQVVKGATVADPAECKALALYSLDRWGEASSAYTAARDAVGANEHIQRTRFGYLAALAALKAGDAAGALTLFDAAGAEARAGGKPDLADAVRVERSRALVALNRFDEAATALSEARTAYPDNYIAWLLSATLSRRQGKLAEAQTQIEQAFRLRPVDPAIGLEAGVIAVLSGRDEAARRSWLSVIAAAPDSDAAKTAKGYLDQLGPAKSNAASTPAIEVKVMPPPPIIMIPPKR